ncbi:hypothetical protein NPIL_34211 [Nephila pilipes]|uniref:Uncharacterized protein n=1 Tax=Nephila pilipes TaxID=299642 RepID=A0A8X6QZY8_NEPPI|nr:hypothetical protein NPIL_34211 [Nephila pilipes]
MNTKSNNELRQHEAKRQAAHKKQKNSLRKREKSRISWRRVVSIHEVEIAREEQLHLNIVERINHRVLCSPTMAVA